MCELAAQVTSSLLHFPEVTVDALGEDEITLDSLLHGKFTIGRSGLAWLACGPHLEVVQVTTGERFSAYCFSGVSEHAPNVLAVRDFCWLKRTGLLVGLEESAGSILCLYDLAISRVVKAVVIPGRITAIEPLVSYGGASTSTQHLHQSLRWFFGVVVVITDVGHVLLVDLCLDDPSCSQSELEASDLEVVNKSPAEIPHIRERVTREGRHLCLQLSSPAGTSATAVQYVTRTNQLAVGFSDGYLQLWNMKTLKKEYHSQLEGGRVPVYAFTFQEPENDPRNCCYLWAVQSTQDHEGDVVSLHLLQLAFGERKCLALGKILYEGLEYCEERYSQDLNGTAFPSRAQATNTRLLGCQTIEKFRHHPDRDDSVNEGASPDTSVSIFTWQVKSYGQGRPTTYIGLFDINRWYHAQMPDSLRTGESLHNCPYLAVWSLDAVVEKTSPCSLLDIVVHERSLSRGLAYTWPLPEQFFNPTTYNFDATCLLKSGIMHVTCSGYQKEALSFLRSAPSLSETIPDGYSRCLMSGLLSPRLVDVQTSMLSQEEQLDAILSTAVETSSLGFITGCIKHWTSEEQPGSVVNLRYILEWAWNRVVLAKEELDGICAPLFDSSSNFTDPQTLQLLQHSQRLLGNLSTIFHCLLNEAHELTKKGLVGLINKNVVSSLISQYAQVVLWFCRTGLLPEGSDDDVLQISRPFYNYPVIKNYYTGRREELQRLSRGKWCSDCLMIDGLVSQFADRLGDLWKRDEGGTGHYPPPTLHALLDIYLLENMEEPAKHAVVIYLLLDVMYSLPNKTGTLVESFPTAFAIPIGLVKLVQGLWLLDHHDHENSVELLLHPATSRPLWAWQHGRVLQALMCQGQHAIALRYLHTMSPPMSSTCPVTLCLSVLLHNRCMVEAWALVRQHSNKLNMEELLRFLYETCLELGLMEELFKLPLGLAEKDCLERFLQGSGGLQNQELLMVHYLQQANYVPALQLNQALRMNLNDPKYKERFNTRNSILDQYGKVLPRVQRRLVTERVKPYHHPSTIHREVSRPQPLSTLAKRSAAENVLTRANFISNVLTKIGEVWEGKDGKPEPSPLKSPSASGLPLTSSHHPSTDLAEAFVGTPIKITSKRMTRILNLIARPSAQTSPEGLGLLQTPTTEVITRSMPSPVPAFSLKPSSLRGTAPELSLLQTPQVVKRARALAPTGPVFPGFTPQSILRSSLRPTPVGSPSASPGRSTTPPSRPKESRITFIEESKSTCHWSNGISAENGIRPLSCTSPLTKLGVEGWMGQPPEQEDEEEEEDVFTFVPQAQLLREVHESEEVGESCSSVHEVVEGKEEDVVGVAEISDASTHYIDTMMELHDTPTLEDPEEQEIEVVVVNVKPEVFPLFPICTGRQELYEAPGEQEDVEPNFREVEAEVGLELAEPNLGLEVLGPNLGQAVEEPDLRKVSGELDLVHVAGEPELGQEAGEPDLVQETFEADPGQEEGEPELGQEAGELELGQEAFESELGQEAWEPVLVQETSEADPGQEEGEPELGQEAGESDLGQEASEPDLGQEASEADLGQEVSEPDLKQEAREPDLRQEASEPDLRQEASESDLRQEASEPDLGQEASELDLGQEASEPDLRQEASEPDLGQEASEPDLGQEASEPDLGQEASEPDLGQEASEPDLGQEAPEPDLGQEASEPDLVQEASEPDLGQEASEPDLGQEASEPDLGQEASEPDLGQEASEPDLGQEASEPELGQEAPEPDLGQEASEPDLGQEASEPDLGQEAPEPDLGQEASEPDLGQEASEPDLGQEAPEPDLGQEAPEPDLGQEESEPDLGQEAPEPDLGQEAPEPDLGQEAPEPDLGQEAPEPDLGQEAPEPDPGQEAAEPDLGQEESEPDLGQEVSEPCVAEQIPVKEEAEPMLEQEKAEQIPKQEDAGKSPELEEVEQNLEQEEMEKRSPEQAQMQYSLEQEEEKQCTEHIGLDEFVEHHLFGNDLSAPLTRSSIRQASQAWATSSDSECSFDARKEAAVTVGPSSPVLTSQKSVTSVSSGAATTTDSHSVVSLNDSEELSRASSEEDSDTTAEEEDSESDVEIIEEVDCNECQKQPQQEPPLGQGYLQEQASAVLSVLTPDVQLEVTTPFNFQQAVGAVGEEEELDIVDLEAQDREEPMCYTELRPSDTLLVPLEPVDEQHLDLHKLEDAREPEVPYTDGSDGLTLMLEAESLENRLTESLKDSDGPLLIMHLPHPGGTQLQQHVCSQEVLCLNKVNADSCEGMSLLPAQPCGLMTQPSKELAIMEPNNEELLHNVVSTSQEPIHCEAQMVEEGLMLIKSKGLAIATKESKAIRVVEEPDEKRKNEGSACLLEEETTCLISEVKLAPSGEESESDFVVQVAEPGPVMEVLVPVPVVKGVEHVPAVVMVELATVFEQAEPTIVEEEAQPGTLTEEAVSRAVVEEAVTGAVVEEAESGAVVESPSVFEEVTPALVVKEAEPAPEVEEMDSVPVYSGVHLGVNSDQPRPTKSMEEAELRDTSVDVGSKIRCAAATEKHWTTRQRKTITFPSPRDEAKSNMQSPEEKPTRITRQTKHEQDSQILTPRRSTRIGIEPKPQKEDKAIDSKTKSTKKQTPQKTPPRRGTRRTRNSHLNIEDIQDTEESIEIELPSLPSSRTRMSVMEVPESETPALLEAKAEPLRSSGMMTRKSSRGLFLALETTQDQIMRSEREGATPKMSQRTVSRGSVVEQCKGSSAAAEELPPPNISRRMTRSSLYNHLAASKGEEKEEHLILRTPLNVETEVANALMERLKDEVAKGSRGRETSDSGTTIIRARKRGTRAPSPPFAMAEELLLDRRGRGLEADMKNQTQSKAQLVSRRTRVSKASETDSSPPRDSFLSSPPQTRRKTKGKRTDSLAQNDIFQVAISAPTTQTRRPATSALYHTVNNEEKGMGSEVQQQTETAKPRKNKTARMKVVTGSPPPVKINIISPMTSPAELAPGVQRKEKEEAPLQRMNLRRKRLLETIFPKPVTRRKML